MAKDSKTIGVTIRFFTNDLAGQADAVSPGHAWAGGMIYVQANTAHGIKAGDPFPFQRMAEIPLALEKALQASGVTLHLGSPSDKLYTMP
jgi:hypothetical protein